MLEKAHRLRKNAEFKFVYRYGKTYSNEWMILRLLRLKDPRKRDQPARIGISVSKKVGGAVVRNKVKRRIAASLYHCADQLPEGTDLVFIARQALRDADFGQTQGAVLRLLAKAKLYGPGS
ncbi:MAG: ribonuclease P protein component [Peptococcaceae bacterium]|nr:ribonuclease P protein component [Peptococcaceae bacterium]